MAIDVRELTTRSLTPEFEEDSLVVHLPVEVARTLAHALGWTCEPGQATDGRVGVRFHPSTT